MESRSESDEVIKQTMKLLSESDCIVLRKSRKTSWYKPHVFTRNVVSKNEPKTIKDEDILIDSGRRSQERKKNKQIQKNIRTEGNMKTNRSLSIQNASHKERIKCPPGTRRKEDNINISIDSMVHMIKLAILEKGEVLLEGLLVQLRGLDENMKNKVLGKLGFDERMLVIRSLYFRKYDKPPTARRKRIVSPAISRSCQRQSSSLSRNEESPQLKKKPVRKSFSFLVADIVEDPFKNSQKDICQRDKLNSNKSESKISSEISKKDALKEDQSSSNILITQINHLQAQNIMLKNTIQNLISNNFNLEQRLEVAQNLNSACDENNSRMESFTRCHDEIIDNVYKAYVQLTKSLKNLKFNRKQSMSTTNLTENKKSFCSVFRTPRSRSEEVTGLRKENPRMNKATSFSKLQSNEENHSVNAFLSNRKENLNNEIYLSSQHLKKIKELIEHDTINSPIHKKHIREKDFLEQQIITLEKMLKSIVD